MGGIAKLGINSTSAPDASLSIHRHYDGAFSGYLVFQKSRSTDITNLGVVSNGDYLGSIEFTGSDGNSYSQGAYIRAIVDGTPGDQDMPTLLTFGTSPDGSATPLDRLTINSAGRVAINTTGIAYSSSEKMSLYNNDFGFGIRTSGAPMGLWHTGTSGVFIGFAYGSGGATAGSISFSGATTAYNTSSDYRLKENVTYTWDATTRLKQLKPARFNWISDDTDTLIDGFLAHEVSSIVPEAVTGEKDAVYTAEEAENAAGAEAGDIKVQVMDNSKLVPLLVKTIQELEERITALEG